MQTEDEDGPGRADPQHADVAGVEQTLPGVGGIEQRHGRDALFEHTKRQGEHQDRRPAETASTHDLADHEGPTSIQGRQDEQR